MADRVEHRVLGAIRLTDRVSETPLERRLRVSSDAARILRNVSGLYVITDLPALRNHAGAFRTPPTAPPIASVAVTGTVSDARGRYLPRRFSVALPRDPDPTRKDATDSLFRAVDLPMYPSTTAKVAANWSAIYVHVEQGGEAARGALLRVIDTSDDATLGSGITDPRGEALVLVPGIPITRFADGDDDASPGPPGGPPGGAPGGPPGGPPGAPDDEPPIVISNVSARIEVSTATAMPWPVDPDLLEAGHAASVRDSTRITLRTGAVARVAFDLT